MTKEQALKLVLDPLYLATLMIKSGDADGEVAGAKNATGDVLRPALQIVKTLPGMSVVSGAFLLLTNKPEYGENGLIVCADCAVLPNPTALLPGAGGSPFASNVRFAGRIVGGFDPVFEKSGNGVALATGYWAAAAPWGEN